MTTTDINQPRPLEGEINRYRLLLYGDHGIGKSRVALDLVRRKGLWLTADSTWTMALTDEWKSKIDRIPWELLSQIPTISGRLKSGELDYDLAILDPTSTVLGEALVKFVDKYKLGAQRAPNLPEYGHYYMVKREAETLVKAMREVPCDVVYVCHTKEDRNRPNMNEEAAKALYRECNLIGYMSRGTDKIRRIQLEPTSGTIAKTQIPGIPEGTYEASKFISMLRDWKDSRG